ncbi:MAG: winged helix-turn-helix transcriptional regulator [Candidatus Thorarchaeota archaeon]
MRYNYRAYLTSLRNISQGLVSRHKITMHMDLEIWQKVSIIASQIGIASSTVRYHLKNMESDGYVEQNPESREWRLLTQDQSQLDAFLAPRGEKKGRK